MTEKADTYGIRTRLWIAHEPSVIGSTFSIGRDAVDALNCLDKNQLADVRS